MDNFAIPKSTGECVCYHGETGKNVYCKQLAYDRYCIWEEGDEIVLKCSDVEVFDKLQYTLHFGVEACMNADPKVIEMELRGIEWELRNR